MEAGIAKPFDSNPGRFCVETATPGLRGRFGYSKEYEIERLYRNRPCS